VTTEAKPCKKHKILKHKGVQRLHVRACHNIQLIITQVFNVYL